MDDGSFKSDDAKAVAHLADVMSETDIHRAALADPDARPLAPERLAGMRRTPQVRVIRRAFGLHKSSSRSAFTSRSAPCETGNRGRKDPDAAAKAYRVVISRNPAAVSKALHPAS